MLKSFQNHKVPFSPIVSLNHQKLNDERNGIRDRECESLHHGSDFQFDDAGLHQLCRLCAEGIYRGAGLADIQGDWRLDQLLLLQQEGKKEAEGQEKTEK